MRTLALAVLVTLGLGTATALAQAVMEPAPAAPPPAAEHGRIESPTVDPAHLPPEADPQRGTRRPSGYWTGYRPALHGAYRWPLVIVGAIVTAGSVGGLAWYLRRIGRHSPAARATSTR